MRHATGRRRALQQVDRLHLAHGEPPRDVDRPPPAVRLDETEYKIKIVGLVDQKAGGGFRSRRGGISPVVSAVYVSMATAEKIQSPGEADKGKAQYLYVRLRDGANVAQFKESWSEHLASEGIRMKFVNAGDIQDSFNNGRGRRRGGLSCGPCGSGNAHPPKTNRRSL